MRYNSGGKENQDMAFLRGDEIRSETQSMMGSGS